MPVMMSSQTTASGCAEVKSEERSGDDREEKAKEAHHAGGDGGERAGAADNGMHPAKEEAINRSEAAAEIGVFAASFRNHGAQFGEGKCAEDGKNGADDPRGKNDGDAAAFAGHFGGLQENSGANHGADNDGRGRPRAQPAHQLQTFFGQLILAFTCRGTLFRAPTDARFGSQSSRQET